MKTSSLGYQEDTEISKSEMAKIQLEEAISMFVGEKFLCALTLAGAADEILSRLLNSRGQPSVMERSAEVILDLKQKMGLTALADVTDKKLFKSWNAARNHAKHHNLNESENVVLNLCDEAYWMIRRALENTKAIGIGVRNEVEFQNWVIININM